VDLSCDTEKLKILVVDDEADIRIFVCNLLGTCGYEAVDAADGVEGLEKAKNIRPALIILDVTMPKEDGIQLYRNLKLDDDLKQVPVIMVSNIDRKTFALYQRFQKLPKIHKLPSGDDDSGAWAYLEKPLEAEDLIRQVRRLIRTEGPPDQVD
jgi:CheY-like chemotaxis protein